MLLTASFAWIAVFPLLSATETRRSSDRPLSLTQAPPAEFPESKNLFNYNHRRTDDEEAVYREIDVNRSTVKMIPFFFRRE